MVASSSSTPKSNVLVVGGGGYGAALARALSAKLDMERHTLTLVSSRDYYLLLVASLRMIVTSEGSMEKSVLIPYDNLFFNGNGTFKQGTVTSIVKNADGKSGHVVLESGEELPWDVLVLAPGNTWEGGLDLPNTRADSEKYIDEWRKKFKAADRVALIGGGAVGIELAGEIRDTYPDKPVSIVQGSTSLLNDAYPTKFRTNMERRVRARNIDLVLGKKVKDLPKDGEKRVLLSDGATLNADLVVPTRGGKPNTAFISSSPSLGPSALTASGHIKVLPTLQLLSETNILAAGDAIDSKEQKQIGKLSAYMGILVGNILAVLEGKEAKKKYKGTVEIIAIPIGRSYGGMYVGLLWGLMFGNWLVSLIKGRGLFVSKIRKELGM